ncbi:hypothetical protein DSCA_21580 [Desulfosarcina alkanivorans]|uniref:Uncharacterized protein n=1 Tax=Desulfosarcina alkanivorans TaxID=571177 RepID=A0A5K7YGL5_9BACT|nr:hypothetical protein [Desulfosarcina alkanivorans]BBO68228.1 hypothetical protein DSCA_21580 [Desulfosarcina alkanivorans]
MQCSFNIEVVEPEPDGMLFQPFVKFRFVQLNDTPELMTAGEIDYQINSMLKKITNLKKTGKKQASVHP